MPDDRLPPPPLHPSELTARFTAALRRPASEVRLDEACVLLAAHFRTGQDEDRTDARAVEDALGRLAASVAEPTIAGVVETLVAHGMGGDASEYARVEASLLPVVLVRGHGLPILLAIVAVEVGRRVGVDARVIGMPGHVLVGSPRGDGSGLADPFHREAAISSAAAHELFRALHGPEARWDPSFLAPIDAHAVVSRVLSNLANRFRTDDRHREEAVALGLRSLVPGGREADRLGLAAALARSGRFDHAAHELEALAELGGAGTEPEVLRTRAQQWRARLN